MASFTLLLLSILGSEYVYFEKSVSFKACFATPKLLDMSTWINSYSLTHFDNLLQNGIKFNNVDIQQSLIFKTQNSSRNSTHVKCKI